MNNDNTLREISEGRPVSTGIHVQRSASELVVGTSPSTQLTRAIVVGVVLGLGGGIAAIVASLTITPLVLFLGLGLFGALAYVAYASFDFHGVKEEISGSDRGLYLSDASGRRDWVEISEIQRVAVGGDSEVKALEVHRFGDEPLTIFSGRQPHELRWAVSVIESFLKEMRTESSVEGYVEKAITMTQGDIEFALGSERLSMRRIEDGTQITVLQSYGREQVGTGIGLMAMFAMVAGDLFGPLFFLVGLVGGGGVWYAGRHLVKDSSVFNILSDGTYQAIVPGLHPRKGRVSDILRLDHGEGKTVVIHTDDASPIVVAQNVPKDVRKEFIACVEHVIAHTASQPEPETEVVLESAPHESEQPEYHEEQW